MGRLACLIVKSTSGEFVDPTTGRALGCVGEGAGVEAVLNLYRDLRDKRVVRRGRDEVGISEIRVLANHTAGGELKAPMRFRA